MLRRNAHDQPTPGLPGADRGRSPAGLWRPPGGTGRTGEHGGAADDPGMRRRGLPPAQRQPAGARACFPCRNGIDRIAMAAHPARLAGSTSRHWLAPAAEMADLASGNWPLSPDLAPMGWTLPRIATRTPGADAGSVRAARDFTIATLQRWGVTERCEDIAIVVSELLTNALQHARPGSGGTRPRWPIRLGLLQPGCCVLCAVADPS